MGGGLRRTVHVLDSPPMTLVFAQISTQTVAGLSVRSFEYSDEVEKRGWYLLFIFFWTTQFIVAMGQIVVALTVVKYYFTRDVETVSLEFLFLSNIRGSFFCLGFLPARSTFLPESTPYSKLSSTYNIPVELARYLGGLAKEGRSGSDTSVQIYRAKNRPNEYPPSPLLILDDR